MVRRRLDRYVNIAEAKARLSEAGGEAGARPWPRAACARVSEGTSLDGAGF
jgi:hypothetical protein